MVNDILDWLDSYEWTQTSNGSFEASIKSEEEKRIILRTINDIRDEINEMVKINEGGETAKPETLSKNETIALELAKVWIRQSESHHSMDQTVDIYRKILAYLNGTET